ncbi:MAG TPA: response regulator [Ktedonobacteraceae bacterium]|jgi:CheY-like chemotaxis protein
MQEQTHALACEEEKKVILLVEDDLGNAEFLKMLLFMETPYEVLYMKSGQEVLNRVEEIKSTRPALFLLDYHLPMMTAFTVYDRLHVIEELAHIPAILLTAAGLQAFAPEEFIRRNIRLIEKPFDIEGFLGLLQEVLA